MEKKRVKYEGKENYSYRDMRNDKIIQSSYKEKKGRRKGEKVNTEKTKQS